MRDSFSEAKACNIRLVNYRKNGEEFINYLHMKPIFWTNQKKKVKFYIAFQIDISQSDIQLAHKLIKTFPDFIFDNTNKKRCKFLCI